MFESGYNLIRLHIKKVEFHIPFRIQQTWWFSEFQDLQDYRISTGLHDEEFAWDKLLLLGFYHYYFYILNNLLKAITNYLDIPRFLVVFFFFIFILIFDRNRSLDSGDLGHDMVTVRQYWFILHYIYIYNYTI